ncbi:MAG: metallophosphoesterase [Candidatus Helarchaeota archaeon]|nr:metallophosphoesterase [Candidatus Helarchaeota archaeon]
MKSRLAKYVDNIPMQASEIQALLNEMKEIFEKEPNIIKIQRGPCLFIGDTHGDFNASLKVIQKFLKEDDLTLVFLGDYVDRGAQQLENVLFLFLIKKDHPERVILLRGNHEEEQMNINYGFQSLLSQQFGKEGEELFTQFQQTFSHLALSVLTWNRVFGVHGGIPCSMKKVAITLKEIELRERGATHLEQFDFITAQMLWNDPKEQIKGAVPSGRGIGFYFGRDKFEQFAETNDINFVIRSHEVFQSGYKYFFDKKLVSIFSALDYVYIHGIQAKMVRINADGSINLKNIAD